MPTKPRTMKNNVDRPSALHSFPSTGKEHPFFLKTKNPFPWPCPFPGNDIKWYGITSGPCLHSSRLWLWELWDVVLKGKLWKRDSTAVLNWQLLRRYRHGKRSSWGWHQPGQNCGAQKKGAQLNPTELTKRSAVEWKAAETAGLTCSTAGFCADQKGDGIQSDEWLLWGLFVINFSFYLARGVGNTIHGSPLAILPLFSIATWVAHGNSHHVSFVRESHCIWPMGTVHHLIFVPSGEDTSLCTLYVLFFVVIVHFLFYCFLFSVNFYLNP